MNDGALWLTWALAFPAAVVFAAVFERFVDAPLQAWIKPTLDGRQSIRWGRTPSRKADALNVG